MASPVPSLFTFCIKDRSLTSLMGCVVDGVSVSIAGTKIRAAGALLVTHWGVSGPAILRLSSYAARHLADNNYRAQLCVNWLNTNGEQEAMDQLQDIQQACSRRQVGNEYPRQFTAKLWQHLLGRAHIDLQKRWNELSNRDLNRLCATLTADVYQIEGKGQYKEEFVTCGGIDLASININTLEARQHPGLYFAGELLDVDGITGGFNLQAAWSMAAVIAEEVTQNNA
jgi:predicted Rossmann fold flavoprotein